MFMSHPSLTRSGGVGRCRATCTVGVGIKASSLARVRPSPATPQISYPIFLYLQQT